MIFSSPLAGFLHRVWQRSSVVVVGRATDVPPPGLSWVTVARPVGARSSLEAIEPALRRLGGMAGLVALGAALAGIGRGLRRAGARQTGGPGVAVGPLSLTAMTAGFLAASAILWHGLPIALGPGARALAAGAGGTALFSGLGLYLSGMAALGPAYNVSSTFGARLYQDQRLVTSGPYAIVRHPMYAGLMIAAVGALVLYRTWTTLAYVAGLPVLIARARREDEVLADRFGAEWEAYRDRVPAWIPRPRLSGVALEAAPTAATERARRVARPTTPVRLRS